MGIDAPVLRGGRLSRATISTYAAGSIGTGGFATLPGLVLTYYLTDSLGVAALMAGVIVTVAKVWDVVIDPVVGSPVALRRSGPPAPNSRIAKVSTTTRQVSSRVRSS